MTKSLLPSQWPSLMALSFRHTWHTVYSAHSNVPLPDIEYEERNAGRFYGRGTVQLVFGGVFSGFSPVMKVETLERAPKETAKLVGHALATRFHGDVSRSTMIRITSTRPDDELLKGGLVVCRLCNRQFGTLGERFIVTPILGEE